MKKYGHLFDSLPITPAEWWDDLLWPAGCTDVASSDTARPLADEVEVTANAAELRPDQH